MYVTEYGLKLPKIADAKNAYVCVLKKRKTFDARFKMVVEAAVAELLYWKI